MKQYFDVKSVSGSGTIKDVDVKSRTVTGYFSRFGNIDSDGDLITYGAFTKTIKERGHEGSNQIVHIADHYPTTDNLLSKPKLYELRDGGYFESTITRTQKGDDILRQYADGLINEHSFGFKTLRAEDKKGYREIKEVIIYEISSVVFGANDQTPFTGFKSLPKPQLIDTYKKYLNAFRNGMYSDDTFHLLEAQIKQLEQDIALKSISEEEDAPASSATRPEVVDNLLIKAAIGNLYLNLQEI